MNKKTIMLSMILGSTIGGYLPTFFGASSFSMTSILFSFVGGMAGIWLSVKWMG
ncbi:MAG: hypothetical protein NT091_04685 [Candidatus Falkowbacteria bacterium]|nr:hypothetical protein [Candidatus Falkowbacteria bacterium]